MPTLLEEERRTLQELDLIESSISKRIKRNPDIYQPPKDHGILGRRRSLPKGETLLQQYEIKQFIERYKSQYDRLSELMDHESIALDGELKVEGNDEDTFDKFHELYTRSLAESRQQAIHVGVKDADIYDMFSSNENYETLRREHEEGKEGEDGKKKEKLKYRVVSEFSRDLKLADLFTQAEEFGKYLDLEDNYKSWLSLPRWKAFPIEELPSYLDYLGQIDDFDDAVFKKSGDYQYYNYLVDLECYLKAYWIRINPLLNPEKSLEGISMKFEDRKFMETRKEGLYCTACEKLFAKDTVYQSHLNGKKHKKSVIRNHRGENLRLEYAIKEITSTLLADQLARTKSEVQRFKLLTVREKQIELRDAKEMSEYEKNYFAVDSEEVEDVAQNGEGKNNSSIEEEEIYNPMKLPLGPDGRPIPYWLWKVRGLDAEFRCEVCGNVSYKGRSNYAKHFSEPRHINGLRMLGVMEKFEIFKDLHKIDDVSALLNNLQKRQREAIHFEEAGEEVEDEDGNAISKKAYVQLKKQGLL
ncbi:DEKNAAC104932 [Brettanomyces naardenensis]|uniref:DEKNAAC104932 n=1 Tax=Brettanomyces naardenensis TaxID=13370 RepID=A0A448YS34_BRENA|nr:DEKNAAC104932 [Brettanomyces naardenensis]